MDDFFYEAQKFLTDNPKYQPKDNFMPTGVNIFLSQFEEKPSEEGVSDDSEPDGA